MNCPTDGTVLEMTERQGIEIDYCPACRGVWLDRGELDKLIDRSLELQRGPAMASYEARPTSPPPPAYGHPRSYEPPYGYRRKKRGWLGELFD